MGQTISDALINLSNSRFKMCIILDSKNNFKGVLNDGDIRRALLKGKNLTSKIDQVYNNKPIIVRQNSVQKKILKRLNTENVDQAPIIKNKKVIGIFSRNNILSESLKTPFVIMCGGLGQRLKPITIKIPKALVPINNKPMLSLVMNNIKKYGFNRFIFSTYYKSSLIKNYYKKNKPPNTKIEYIRENKPLGTAGSLSLLKNKIKEKNLLITNCDIISKINYKSLLNFHNDNKADLTIAIKKYYSESQFGEMDINGIYVKNIIEKPTKDVIINAAIYAIKTNLIKELKFNKHKNMDEFIKELIKKKKKVIAFPFYESWFDLGTKKQIKIFKQNL